MTIWYTFSCVNKNKSQECFCLNDLCLKQSQLSSPFKPSLKKSIWQHYIYVYCNEWVLSGVVAVKRPAFVYCGKY